MKRDITVATFCLLCPSCPVRMLENSLIIITGFNVERVDGGRLRVINYRLIRGLYVLLWKKSLDIVNLRWKIFSYMKPRVFIIYCTDIKLITINWLAVSHRYFSSSARLFVKNTWCSHFSKIWTGFEAFKTVGIPIFFWQVKVVDILEQCRASVGRVKFKYKFKLAKIGCLETLEVWPTLFRIQMWYFYARIHFRLRMYALKLFWIHLPAESQQENHYQWRSIVAQLVICVSSEVIKV